MFQNSVPLLQIFGIQIKIHVSWLIIFILITWSLALGFPQQHPDWSSQLRWGVAVATSLLFFLSILLHELAHSLIARMQGLEVKDIVLFIFGGVSQIREEPVSAKREFLMAFVGPLTSFALGGLCFVVYFLIREASMPAAAIARYLAYINVLLGAFNLVPGFPLDGGRVLRSIIWGITGDLQKATRWAARSGIFVSYALILLGILAFFNRNPIGGLWFAFIGWFLNNAAQSTQSHAVIKQILEGHKVRELVSQECASVSAEMSLEELVHDHFLAKGCRCLPVIEENHMMGLVTVHNVKQAPREAWPQIRVRQVMVPLDRVIAVRPDQDLWSAFEQMSESGVNQLAVMEDGRLAGMLGRDAVIGFIRLHAELEG